MRKLAKTNMSLFVLGPSGRIPQVTNWLWKVREKLEPEGTVRLSAHRMGVGRKGEGAAGGRKANEFAQIGVELTLKHRVHLSKVTLTRNRGHTAQCPCS